MDIFWGNVFPQLDLLEIQSGTKIYFQFAYIKV